MTRPSSRNPFDRFDLDPASDLAAITDALRERAEEASSDTERAEIRAAWESLTLHPETRLGLALTAVPETRAPIGSPPRAPVRASATTDRSNEPLGLLDLVSLPPLPDELDRTLGPEDDAERALWAPRRVTSS